MYINNQPRMSKREKELTKASELGRMAFEYGESKGLVYAALKHDEQLKQAWDNGYLIAKEQHIADYNFMYRNY